MAEEVIKARIVFDDSGVKRAMGVGGGSGKSGGGFSEALSKTAFAQDSPVWGDILAGVGGAVLALTALKNMVSAGFKRLVDASPHLQATLEIMSKTLKLTLRPIADTLSSFVRPFVLGWLRFVLPIYKAWRTWFGGGGGAEAKAEMGAGIAQIKTGFAELDFQKMFEGFKQVAVGFFHLFGSFWEEVLKPQFDPLLDWWARAQETFGTSGIFDTLLATFKEMALEGIEFVLRLFGKIGDDVDLSSFGQAFNEIIRGTWLDFLRTDMSEAEEVDLKWWQKALKTGFEWFREWAATVGEMWWLGPLAPLATALVMIWEKAVEPLVVLLKNAILEALGNVPLLGNLIPEVDPEENEEAINNFKESMSAFKDETGELKSVEPFFTFNQEVMNYATGLNTARLSTTDLGDESKVQTDRMTEGFNLTEGSMLRSIASTMSLISKLQSIPARIVTTHIIRTVREDDD